MTLASQLVIGVDGGGTKTACWLAAVDASAAADILGRGQAGPGNPRAAGFEVAQANIETAIAAAFADAGLPRARVAAACLALAGAGRAAEQDRIRSWAENHGLADRVHVVGDAEPILAAASPENIGVVLICGTGSLAWGRNRAGQVARCGGWGYLLGDDGSAYAIAIAGLRAAVRAADGRGSPSALLPAFQQRFTADSPGDMIEKVYHPDLTRERLAQLADVIFEAAATDVVADTIIDAAAAELADSIAIVARRLGLDLNNFPLAMAGGLALNQAGYRARIESHLRQLAIRPARVECVAEPVRGAVALARRGLAEKLPA